MDKLDLIKYVVENDMINLKDLQDNVYTQKRVKVLSGHLYKIWQGKNGKWYTYLPDEGKGRILVKRTTKESIEDAIVAHYESVKKDMEPCNMGHTMTLRTLYDEWIEYKTYHTTSSSYIRRINIDWKKFYEHDPISDMPIHNITKMMIDKWMHRKIKEYDMSKTKFYNMSIIFRQSFEYALENGYISKNVCKDVSIDKRMFRGKKQKQNSKQVFLTNEEPILKQHCYEMYMKSERNTTPLAILLMFELGCRVGELVALSNSDIQGNYIHISKQEVSIYNLESKRYEYLGTKVVPYTKSECGDREVYLTETARRLIDKIKSVNKRCGYQEGDFLILNYNGRTHGGTINKRLGEYCDVVGVEKKSSHKIRKTYVSKLIDGGVNIKTVMRQVGHANEKTTYGNYCFDRSLECEIENRIEKALKTK